MAISVTTTNKAVSSGSKKTSNEHVTFVIKVTLASQSITNNTSTINVELCFKRDNGFVTGPANGNCTVTINGTDYKHEWTDMKSITNTKTTTLFSKSGIVVKHNDNGTKTVNVSLKSLWMNVSNPKLTQNSTTQSESFTLPTIQRASAVTWGSKTLTFNGSSVYLTGKITPKFTGASHKIIININNKDYTQNTITYSDTTAHDFRQLIKPEVLEAIFNASVSSASVTGTAEIVTLSSGTKIGSSKTQITFNIGDYYKPKVSIDHITPVTRYYTKFALDSNGEITASGATTTTLTSDDSNWKTSSDSKYIPGLLSGISQIGAYGMVGQTTWKVNGSDLNTGTYIKKIQCIVNSSLDNSTEYALSDKKTEVRYSKANLSYYVSSPAGTANYGKCSLVTTYVYDYRGKTASISESRTVYRYTKPKITKYTVKTSNNSNGKLNINYSLNISSVSNIATWAFIRYKATTEKDWSAWSNIINQNVTSNGLHSYSSVFTVDDPKLTYQVQFAVCDASGMIVKSASITPQTGDVLIGISSNNKSMIIGGPVSKIHNSPNQLIIGMGYTKIESNETIIDAPTLRLAGIVSGSGSPLVIDPINDRTVRISSSSRKYKKDIEYNLDEEKLHDDFIHLKPVKFKYKSTPDVTDYGLIAEDVYDIDPDFTNFNPDTNEVENFKDRSILVLLINELQRSNKRITELEEIIRKLQEQK